MPDEKKLLQTIFEDSYKEFESNNEFYDETVSLGDSFKFEGIPINTLLSPSRFS